MGHRTIDPEMLELYKSRRTEANPKHSLFGTALEIHDEDERESLHKMDTKNLMSQFTERTRYVLPDSMKAKLPGKAVYERANEELLRQQKEVDMTRKSLEQSEKKTFMFCKQKRRVNASHADIIQSERSQRWMSEKDLDHAKEMNRVGLNERGSYNRDKYEHRSPAHTYSLVGDILRPGMEFSPLEREKKMKTIRRDLLGNSISPARSIREVSSQEDNSIVRLPPNIRHQFGSRVCDMLLSDKEKVEEILRHQHQPKGSRHRSSAVNGPGPTKDLTSEYESLGNAMRQNLFPGFTADIKQSCTKSEFNDTVHLQRHPDPDQYRYKKDELSAWSEQQIIQERMQKKWKEYFGQTIFHKKIMSRPKTEPILPKTKKKQKLKRVKKDKVNNTKNENNEEPEFRFETPPITPQPQSPIVEKLSAGFQKDEEFWKLYGGGA